MTAVIGVTAHQQREAIRRRDKDAEMLRSIARSYNVSAATIRGLGGVTLRRPLLPLSWINVNWKGRKSGTLTNDEHSFSSSHCMNLRRNEIGEIESEVKVSV